MQAFVSREQTEDVRISLHPVHREIFELDWQQQ